MPSLSLRDGLGGRPTGWVLLAAALAFAARLPLLGVPLSSDEAGFLVVAGQWGPGSSLYGDYFVDRPPGLIAIFAGAAALDGQTALRLIGGLFAAASVLAAGWLARVVVPERRDAAVVVAAVTAAMLSSGLLNVTLVNGEILALPFVLAGLAALLLAARPDIGGGAAHPAWSLAAGAAGAAAVMVKQNFAEVPVAAVLVLAVVGSRGGLARALRLGAGLVVGAVAVVVPLLVVSTALGTDLGDLWYAVVTFRAEASAVIASSASEGTTVRAWKLLGSAFLTGAPLALALAWRRPWRLDRTRGRDHVFTWLATLVVTYDVVSIAAGGSYWLHYLVQLVPAVVLLVATSYRDAPATPPRLRAAVVGVLVVASLVAFVAEVVAPRARDTDEVAVVDYLRAHAQDAGPRTMVVAFGNAWLLEDAGMSSPYTELWSLPVRVRDPDLTALTAVLAGPDRPTWLVLSGPAFESWGIDGRTVAPVVERDYAEVFASGELRVLRAPAAP